MNIVLVTGGENRIVGNAGGYLYTLAKNFAESGYEVTVLDRMYSIKDSERETLDGIEVCRLSAVRFDGRLVRKLATWVRAPLTLALLLNEATFALAVGLFLSKRGTFRVIHVFTVALSFVALMIWPSLRERTVYVSITARRLKEDLSLSDRFAVAVENRIVGWARRTVTLNDLARGRMVAAARLRDKVSVIPPGIDPRTYDVSLSADSVREKFALGEDPIVLFVGRMTESKGVEYLIHAARRIVDGSKWTGVQFVLVGPGEGFGMRALKTTPYVSKVFALVQKYGLQAHVRWLGAVSFPDLLLLYRSCEIFVLPTLFEQMPYVIKEAMAFAKPIVATRVDGIPLMIEDGVSGLLVEPRDGVGLAERILYLLQYPDVRLRLGSRAREIVLEQFGWDPIIRAWRQLHERVAVDAKGW